MTTMLQGGMQAQEGLQKAAWSLLIITEGVTRGRGKRSGGGNYCGTHSPNHKQVRKLGGTRFITSPMAGTVNRTEKKTS